MLVMYVEEWNLVWLGAARILAVANQKGGVADDHRRFIGAALADLDTSVLVVDLDPQGCLTFSLGHNPDELEASVHDVLLGDEEIADVLLNTDDNVTLLPRPSIWRVPRGAAVDAAGTSMRSRALAEVPRILMSSLVDCPPSLGVLTLNGTTAADQVIVPVRRWPIAVSGS